MRTAASPSAPGFTATAAWAPGVAPPDDPEPEAPPAAAPTASGQAVGRAGAADLHTVAAVRRRTTGRVGGRGRGWRRGNDEGEPGRCSSCRGCPAYFYRAAQGGRRRVFVCARATPTRRVVPAVLRVVPRFRVAALPVGPGIGRDGQRQWNNNPSSPGSTRRPRCLALPALPPADAGHRQRADGLLRGLRAIRRGSTSR